MKRKPSSNHPATRALHAMRTLSAFARVQLFCLLVKDIFELPPLDWPDGQHRTPTRDELAAALTREIEVQRKAVFHD